VSVPLSVPLPDPQNASPLPWLAWRDPRELLWQYRLLRSVQKTTSTNRFIHVPFYRPFVSLVTGQATTPLLPGADHYFEWRSALHSYPIFMLLISVNPTFQFSIPQVINSNHRIYGCPHLHILYWDFPLDIPSVATEFILNCNRAFDADLEEFLYQVDLFACEYFRPVSPYKDPQHLILHPQNPPPLPHPFQTTVPLGSN
jgi:hypothetical protein